MSDSARGSVPSSTRSADVPDPAVPRSATRVGVWGHFSGRNLGDELVVGLIVDALTRRRPDVEVVAISMAPSDTRGRHGVATYPINPGSERSATDAAVSRFSTRTAVRRPFLARAAWKVVRTTIRVAREIPFVVRSYRRLQEIDALVVSGSGQLLDAWMGPWWHPYTTFRWALLARITGTPMIYPSVGAGPIDRRLSRFLIRKSVDWAAYATVREAHSARLLHAIGVQRELPIRPDIGWAWRPNAPPGHRPDQTDAAAVVGVNPMSHEDPRYWPRGDRKRYEIYVEKVAEVVAHLLRQGNRVVLFSSQPGADVRVAADLEALLEQRGLAHHPLLSTVLPEISDTQDVIRIVGGCDYVLAGRFHSVLLPLAMGIPTLGLAYHPKTAELLVAVGRPERCVDIDTFTVDALVAAFDRMKAEDGADERQTLFERAEGLRALVEEQFDELLGPEQGSPN